MATVILIPSACILQVPPAPRISTINNHFRKSLPGIQEGSIPLIDYHGTLTQKETLQGRSFIYIKS